MLQSTSTRVLRPGFSQALLNSSLTTGRGCPTQTRRKKENLGGPTTCISTFTRSVKGFPSRTGSLPFIFQHRVYNQPTRTGITSAARTVSDGERSLTENPSQKDGKPLGKTRYWWEGKRPFPLEAASSAFKFPSSVYPGNESRSTGGRLGLFLFVPTPTWQGLLKIKDFKKKIQDLEEK